MIVEYDEYSMASDIGYMSRNDKKITISWHCKCTTSYGPFSALSLTKLSRYISYLTDFVEWQLELNKI